MPSNSPRYARPSCHTTATVSQMAAHQKTPTFDQCLPSHFQFLQNGPNHTSFNITPQKRSPAWEDTPLSQNRSSHKIEAHEQKSHILAIHFCHRKDDTRDRILDATTSKQDSDARGFPRASPHALPHTPTPDLIMPKKITIARTFQRVHEAL